MRKRPNLVVVAFMVAVSIVVLIAQGSPVTLRTGLGVELGTSAAPIRNDPTGSTTQPVSGTFWQATQPVSGTFWQATQPISAASLPLPTGAAADSSLTTLDTDVKANIVLAAGAHVIGHVIADSGSTTAVTGNVTVVQPTGTNLHAVLDANSGVDIGKLTANQSVNVAQVGGTAIVANPCLLLVPTTVAISQTASTKLISQASAKTNYLCGGVIVAGAAEIVNIVEGTGSTCGTSTAAVAGSTTAANGMSFAANGGFSINSAIKGTGTNLDLCLSQSGSNRLSGWISYVQQ